MSILSTGTTIANVTVKVVNGTIQSTNKVNPVTLSTASAGVTRFDQLTDVAEDTPTTGDVVVYNANTDKYEIKSLSETSAELDGGEF